MPGNNDGGAVFIISFEINLRQHPVLILEVKPPQHLSLNSTRGGSRQADSPPFGRFVRRVASLQIAFS